MKILQCCSLKMTNSTQYAALQIHSGNQWQQTSESLFSGNEDGQTSHDTTPTQATASSPSIPRPQTPTGSQTPTSSRTPASSQTQMPTATADLTPTSSRTPISFRLPKFDPDLESALEKDSFFNPNKRAKLIWKACEALAGYCREKDQVVTHSLQEGLATALLQRAPNSFGDPATINQDPAVSNNYTSSQFLPLKPSFCY